ncbi:MAG: hypothetical protein OEY89_17615, partial [Gammaproteobacteria bacterium]|nr:hypothetical protein [Gammaproteobacteria bacterium]
QFPYNVANPNVSETVLYKNVDEDSMDSLSKIIEWPKLSSLVIVKGGIEDFGENFKTGFMHIALAIQSGFDYGNVFHSKMFICRPDDDYMNHIEFPPYIMNGLVEMVEQIFYQNNRTELMKYVDIKAVDPLIVSLNVFGSYFRGKYALNQELKKQMKKTVKEEFYNFKISRLYKKDFYLSILKFAISYIYNVIFRAGK